MKKILIMICMVLLCGCFPKEVKVIQKNDGYTIKKIGSIEYSNTNDSMVTQYYLCGNNSICVNTVQKKYEIDLLDEKIIEVNHLKDSREVKLQDGSNRNSFVHNYMFYSTYFAQMDYQFKNFQLLEIITNDYGRDDGKTPCLTDTFYYIEGGKETLLFEYHVYQDSPTLSQYVYYDAYTEEVFLTYPTQEDIILYKIQNQSIQEIDRLSYTLDDSNYVSSYFERGKIYHEYENKHLTRIYHGEMSIEFKKSYDYKICDEFIFVFSNDSNEPSKIINIETSEEKFFESNLNLKYASYFDHSINISFLAYDSKKECYSYHVYDGEKFVSYLLPFENEVRIIKIDGSHYGFVVNENQERETFYLFEVGDE